MYSENEQYWPSEIKLITDQDYINSYLFLKQKILFLFDSGIFLFVCLTFEVWAPEQEMIIPVSATPEVVLTSLIE